MRCRRFLPLLTLAAVITVGVIWQWERAAAKALQDRFAVMARQEENLAQLQAQGERLRRELQVAARPLPADHAVPSLAPAPIERPVAPVWPVGEWMPATAWRNAGRASPQATTTTLLWAAASGDVASVRDTFQFGDDARAKARAWFDTLPPESRLLYATPEDLVAGVTLAHISPDRAQLSWLHEIDGDRAIVGLLVAGNRAASAPPLPVLTNKEARNLPPALDDRARYNVVVLNLQRAPDGWRVEVPAAAIDNMARNLRAPSAK